MIAFVAALGEGFRDTYGQNVNDDPTVSGTPSQCVPDLYPGSEYIQQNPDSAGTVTIDRTGIIPALVFDDAGQPPPPPPSILGNCPIEKYSIALLLRSLEGNLDAVPAQNRLQRFVAVS